jgi:hypothetical protein
LSNAAIAQVLLAGEDQQHLQDKGYDFAVAQNAGFICVLIRNFMLASRYTPTTCDVLLRLPPNFPMAKPDMFWTNPHVRLTNGSYPPQADVFDVNFDGRQWQRWSRHLDSAQWRPGKDNLRTFLGIIRRELQEGL